MVKLKSQLDREVAFELGEIVGDVGTITEVFLRHLMTAIINEKTVRLPGFGRFKLIRQRAATPVHSRFSTGESDSEVRPFQYRVHFAKSIRFREELRKRTTRRDGKARRR